MSGYKVREITQLSKPPLVCSKPNCESDHFIPHEDGWQCLNCMKIIYRYPPLPHIANNRPERVGCYNSQGVLKLKNCESNDGHLCPTRIDQNDDSERWVAEDFTVIDSDFWDWFSDSHEPYVISRINKFFSVE